MIILQLIGTRCSGRRKAVQPLVDSGEIALFDMLDYYKSRGCLRGDIVDWDFGGREALERLPLELDRFLQSNLDKAVSVILHSFNRTIEETIENSDFENYKIQVFPSTDQVLTERAKSEGVNPKVIKKLAHFFRDKFNNSNLQTHFEGQIELAIRSLILKNRIFVRNKKNYSGLGELVDRTTILGNPFQITARASREDVIESYRDWLWNELTTSNYLAASVRDEVYRLLEIARKGELNLVCHCKPLPCHGDILRNCLAYLEYRDLLYEKERTQNPDD